jgi:hypothetical protein
MVVRGVIAPVLLGGSLAACSSGSNAPTSTPTAAPTASASATPTAAPVAPGLAVVVRLTPDTGSGWIFDGSSWDIDLRRADGSLAATAHAAHAGGIDPFNALPMSATSTAVYYLDGATTVRRLAPDGSSGVATTVPADGGGQRVLFAVSPDDTRIAVAVFRPTSGGTTHETLTVRSLAGGDERTLADFDSHDAGPPAGADRSLERPLGWHGDMLVVSTAPRVQNSPNGLLAPLEPIALYDTTSAGGAQDSPCGERGAMAHPQAAGVVCDGALHRWDGSRVTLPTQDDLWVTSDGGTVAGATPSGIGIAAASASALVPSTEQGLIAGWLDATHLAVQLLQTRGRSHILTVSRSAVQAGPNFDGYAVDAIPALLR